ncbi:hypothetical protein HZH68_009670 [Vespula germanica]|uniref:Uncharacterized protein n=1 Tax=Vespula germanica TaxID=30212 RepID=A0A834JWX5_VESGE|nr:hypothetical protein HZH68_009670 [Vespula germanica]
MKEERHETSSSSSSSSSSSNSNVGSSGGGNGGGSDASSVGREPREDRTVRLLSVGSSVQRASEYTRGVVVIEEEEEEGGGEGGERGGGEGEGGRGEKEERTKGGWREGRREKLALVGVLYSTSLSTVDSTSLARLSLPGRCFVTGHFKQRSQRYSREPVVTRQTKRQARAQERTSVKLVSIQRDRSVRSESEHGERVTARSFFYYTTTTTTTTTATATATTTTTAITTTITTSSASSSSSSSFLHRKSRSASLPLPPSISLLSSTQFAFTSF